MVAIVGNRVESWVASLFGTPRMHRNRNHSDPLWPRINVALNFTWTRAIKKLLVQLATESLACFNCNTGEKKNHHHNSSHEIGIIFSIFHQRSSTNHINHCLCIRQTSSYSINQPIYQQHDSRNAIPRPLQRQRKHPSHFEPSPLDRRRTPLSVVYIQWIQGISNAKSFQLRTIWQP